MCSASHLTEGRIFSYRKLCLKIIENNVTSLVVHDLFPSLSLIFPCLFPLFLKQYSMLIPIQVLIPRKKELRVKKSNLLWSHVIVIQSFNPKEAGMGGPFNF